MSRAAPALALALLAALLAGPALAAPRVEPPLQRGIALGLFAEDPAFSYAPLLEEIKRSGAKAEKKRPLAAFMASLKPKETPDGTVYEPAEPPIPDQGQPEIAPPGANGEGGEGKG